VRAAPVTSTGADSTPSDICIVESSTVILECATQQKKGHKLIVPSPFRVQISLRDPLTNQDHFIRWASTHVSKIINDFHVSVKSIADFRLEKA
jgi:hypothetical protein